MEVFDAVAAGHGEDDVPTGIEERDGFAGRAVFLLEIRESLGQETAFPFCEKRS